MEQPQIENETTQNTEPTKPDASSSSTNPNSNSDASANSNNTNDNGNNNNNNTANASSKDRPEAAPANDNDINVADFDTSTPSWFYMDSNGIKQGPFSFREMFLWFKTGYFAASLLVKTAWDDHFQSIGDIPEFYNCPPKLVERIEREQEEQMRRGQVEFPVYGANIQTSVTPPPQAQKKYEDYAVKGTFNPLTGRFQKTDTESHFASKGLPSDRETRMISHYFDLDQYQEMRNAAAAANAGKQKKQVKGSKKFWKERKAQKKRAKLIAEYLAD